MAISDFAYQHRYIILAIVLIDSIMASLDSSMVNIVLPTITTVFHSSLADSQWVVTAYLITMTSLFIICGVIMAMLMTLVLHSAGFFGPVLQADAGLLSWASAAAVMVTGAVCIPGAYASYALKRNGVNQPP